MKIILTAFNKRLVSEPMDMPLETGHRISLFLPMDGRLWAGYSGKVEQSTPPCPGVGFFEDTNYSYLIHGEPVREYRLVEWRRS